MIFKIKNPRHLIISRPDSIGDAVLAFPVAKALKDAFPGIRIGYLGKAYVRDLVHACENVDEFIEIDQFMSQPVTVCGQPPDTILHLVTYPLVARRAKQLKIPVRIGTTNRLYHWSTCNRLVMLSRKNSDLHEAQLNLKLLSALGIKKVFSLPEITNMYGLTRTKPLAPSFASLAGGNKYNIILHPKSQGNAAEWGIHNFISLIKLLNPDEYRIFITGVENDKPYIEPLLHEVGDRVIDITGKIDLAQLVSFISQCQGLVACSTGPVHLAAALGIDTYGLYSVHRPIFSKRWGPVGKHVFVLESQRKKYATDMDDILPEQLYQLIDANRLKQEHSILS